MKLRDIFTRKMKFRDFFAAGKRTQRRLRFFTLSGARGQIVPQNETKVVLVPFRTLAAYPFAFPFGRKGRVRDALELKFRPILGEKESGLSLIPQVTEQKLNETNGVAWFTSTAETEELESEFGGAVFWPEPCAFASEVGGTGAVVCRGSGGISGMAFSGGAPLIYRWMPDRDGEAETLLEWLKKYAESKGVKDCAEKIIDIDTASDIQRCGDASLNICRGLDTLDLSTSGADTAEQAERFIALGSKISLIMTVLGAVFLLFSLMILIQNTTKSGTFADAPSEAYKSAFGESSRSPLTSAAKKLRLLAGTGAQMTFDQTLGNISAAWSSMPAGTQVKLDSLRYGPESTELQGLASATGDIDRLREALSSNGFRTAVGDIQQVPNSGLRFNIVLNETAGTKR